MSYRATNWAYDLPLRGTAKPVLVALADMADEQNSCYPGQSRIAEMTGLSVKTVARALLKLEELGLLSRSRRANSGGHRTSDRYVLDLTKSLPDTEPTGQGAYKAESPSLTDSLSIPNGQSDRGTIREPLENHQISDSTASDDIPVGTTTANPLPKPFTVTAEMRAWAAATVPSVDVDVMTSEFVAYWREGEGKDKRKKNWVLTWRNWAKRARQDDVRRGVVADEDIRDGILWRNGMPTLGGPQGMTTEQYRAWQDEREEFMRARNAQ